MTHVRGRLDRLLTFLYELLRTGARLGAIFLLTVRGNHMRHPLSRFRLLHEVADFLVSMWPELLISSAAVIAILLLVIERCE